MKNDDEHNIYNIIEKLGKIHIQQAKLFREEQELTRQLVITTTRRDISIEAIKRTESFKARAVGGKRHEKAQRVNEQPTVVRITDVAAVNNSFDRIDGQTVNEARKVENNFDQVVCPTKNKTDKFGNSLEIGDEVEFLTEGLYKAKRWKIYKLTEKRVLCKRKGSQKTHREYHNVKKIFP